jgi:Fic-DOC domain mobile mystery protein B
VSWSREIFRPLRLPRAVTANRFGLEEFLSDALQIFDGGEYRCTDKNIGVPFHEIRERVGTLVGDVRYWIENNTYSPDAIAVRFHHRLVLIHPFANGNGRHARLIADVLAMKLGRPSFTWGAASLVKEGEAREKYLQAIRTADNGEIQPLLKFARS